jgi:hypothetical protein
LDQIEGLIVLGCFGSIALLDEVGVHDVVEVEENREEGLLEGVVPVDMKPFDSGFGAAHVDGESLHEDGDRLGEGGEHQVIDLEGDSTHILKSARQSFGVQSALLGAATHMVVKQLILGLGGPGIVDGSLESLCSGAKGVELG